MLRTRYAAETKVTPSIRVQTPSGLFVFDRRKATRTQQSMCRVIYAEKLCDDGLKGRLSESWPGAVGGVYL